MDINIKKINDFEFQLRYKNKANEEKTISILLYNAKEGRELYYTKITYSSGLASVNKEPRSFEEIKERIWHEFGEVIW